MPSSAFHIRWPKYWSFSLNISPSNEHPGLISFRIDWLDLLAVQGTLKSLLQHHSSKASILQHSAFLTVQHSHPYMTTGKTIALTKRTFVGKVMSLLFNMLSRLVITFLPRNAAAAAKSLQSSPTLHDPIDGSPPGSRIPGILQARVLEWVAISFSNAWKWKVKVKLLSHARLLATHGLQPTRLLSPRDFPGKNTGVGCRCLLQKVYPSFNLYIWYNWVLNGTMSVYLELNNWFSEKLINKS